MAPNFGMYPLIWAALGQAFGRKAFSTIRGTIMAFQIGSIMGMPILAGFLFDRSGSYTGVLWITFALWVAAGTLMLVTRERTYVIHRSAPLEPATTRSSR
jgi:MFS family permease